MNSILKRPELARVPQFYHTYINLVEGTDLIASLEQNQDVIGDFLAGIPEERWSFRYAPEKWSIKEVVQHMIDTDRIFSYRALCFARGETGSLPGFDENAYAAHSKAEARTKHQLLAELKTVQEATHLLFKSFDGEQLERFGTANNNPIQVLALGFIAVGHMLHHMKVLQEKYLS